MGIDEVKIMSRVILHCDLNSFFASVELLDKPELRNKCVAVGGDEKARQGIVLAKNDNAKKYGVTTGETLWTAKMKCPQLIVLPPHFEKYLHYSRRVREIYCRYTDMVESFGIDECWLDVTGSYLIFGDGMQIAESVRKTVKAETGLTISVGVSFCKIMAKLGSDLKKPDAITEIRMCDLEKKVYPLPCFDMFGVGKATAQKLKTYGINTIGELARASDGFMKSVFGKSGETILRYARGLDDSPVTYADYVPEIKSISHGCTSAFDLTDRRSAELLILSLSESIAEKLRKYDFSAHTVQLFIKDTKLAGVSFSKTVDEPIRSSRQICSIADSLLSERWTDGVPIRAISVCVTSLVSDCEPFQTDLYTDYENLDRVVKMESAADKIRNKMGSKAIVRASLMNVDFARKCAIYEFNPFGHNTIGEKD